MTDFFLALFFLERDISAVSPSATGVMLLDSLSKLLEKLCEPDLVISALLPLDVSHGINQNSVRKQLFAGGKFSLWEMEVVPSWPRLK